MPASLHIDAYPHHLYMIVESVLLNQREVKIEAATHKIAITTRRQLYGLRKALLNSSDHPLKEHAAKLTTELQENTLFIRHVDASVDSSVVKAAQQLMED